MPVVPKAVTYFAALAPQRVDVEAGTVTGMCLMKIGPARGHGTAVDGKTLDMLVSECSKLGNIDFVIKHDGHPLEVIGDLSNFRRDGDTARADLDVYKSFPQRAQFLEIASRNPRSFGTSAEFRRTDETIANTKFARVHEVRRFALERDTAASPNGLFSEGDNPDFIMTDDDKKTIADIIAAQLKPVTEKVDRLETKFNDAPKPPTAEEQKARDEKLVLDGYTKFAAEVGIKRAPKNSSEGGEGTDPDHVTKFKVHKAAAPNVGVAITRFAHDNPEEYNRWDKAGRPGL